MPVPNRFILHQAPVLAGLGRALVSSMLNRRRPQKGGATVPGPLLESTLAPRDKDLVRCYVRQMGGDPSAYKRTLPAHLFPQWGFPMATQALSVLDYPLQRTLNAGCHMEINAPLPQGEPLHVKGQLVSVDSDERRVLMETRIVTGTKSEPEALVGTLTAIIPRRKKGGGAKAAKKEPPRVPHASQEVQAAREVHRWKLKASAGLEYAKLTGDFNPIHWVPALAKASGFSNVILHGFATMAYAIEGLHRGVFSGDINALKTIDVRFTAPLVLPRTVGLYLSDDDSITVGDGPGGRAYLTGAFTRT